MLNILIYIETVFSLDDFSLPEKQPLGGTETAVCRIARALIRQGHRVRIAYAPDELRRCDVLVVSRRWPLVVERAEVAPVRYLWMPPAPWPECG